MPIKKSKKETIEKSKKETTKKVKQPKVVEKKSPYKKVKREKATSTKGHYITNATLLPAVLEAKKLGRITDTLAKMFLMITERYSKKSNFVGYSFREDMVSVALINLCANGLKFNPKKSSNPFAFYTTMIHNSFLQYMNDEKKHRNIRDELILEIGSNPSNGYMNDSHDDYMREHNSDDGFTPAPVHIEVNKVGNPYEYSATENADDVVPNMNTERKKPKRMMFGRKKKEESKTEEKPKKIRKTTKKKI